MIQMEKLLLSECDIFLLALGLVSIFPLRLFSFNLQVVIENRFPPIKY